MRPTAPKKEVARSRVQYSAPTTPIGAIARAAVFYEVAHIPKRGFTSKEIADKYHLGETWYEYEDSPRRVNLATQLIRNDLNQAFKERKIMKLWSPRTGKLVKRDGYIVFVPPGVFPDTQVEYGIGLPDRHRWGYE
jgi:hypothetical protein